MAEENYWDKLSGTDEAAATYMLTYGEGPGCETRMLVGSFIQPGESVLDVGCGPGWNFDHFREFGPRVGKYMGLDYSERFVRVANERFLQKYPQSQNNKNYNKRQPDVPFRKGDVRHITQRDNSWDVVILQDVLEHTNGYEAPVKEALRVASKRVIVAFWHLTENDDHINEDGGDGYGAWYSRGKWEAFLNELGYPWEWTETQPNANRHHDVYVIEKEIDA